MIDQTSEGVCACLDRIQLLIAYCFSIERTAHARRLYVEYAAATLKRASLMRNMTKTVIFADLTRSQIMLRHSVRNYYGYDYERSFKRRG